MSFTIAEDGTVYRFIPNPEPDDMDSGSSVVVSAADLLLAAQRFLSDWLIEGALDIQARS